MSNENIIISAEPEIWIPVKGYEAILEVSSYGRVKRKSRWSEYTCRGWPQKRYYEEKMLKLSKDKDNYIIASSKWNGIKFRDKVHRMVCSAFHNNPDNKPCVNHKDSDRSNNHKDNVEWATWKENAIHGNMFGYRIRPEIPPQPGASNPRALAIGKFSMDGQLLESFSYMKEVEEKYGISVGMVRKAVKGYRKSYRGFLWKYI